MNKIDRLYSLYTAADTDKKTLMNTLRIVDIKLYYKLQAQIFINAQEQGNKYIAAMVADDIMSTFEKFELKHIEYFIDEMEFIDCPLGMFSSNKDRLECLNYKQFQDIVI